MGRKLLLLFAVIITFISAFISLSGFLPYIKVVDHDGVLDSDIEFLKSHNMLDEDETIQYFYSTGFFSASGDGNYFTEKRVVSYWTENDQTLFCYGNFDEVEDIKVVERKNDLEDTIMTIYFKDGSDCILMAFDEHRRDRIFARELVSTWEQAKLD